MVTGLLDGFGQLIEQLAEADQRIDQESGQNGERYRRNQTGDLSNTHHEPHISRCTASCRAHNTVTSVANAPDAGKCHWLYETTVSAWANGACVSKSNTVTLPLAGRSPRS